MTAIVTVVTCADLGCAHPEPVSFASLGTPRPADLEDRVAVVFGWAIDERGGWTVDHVRVDGRDRPEWDRESQRPTVFYVRPGQRTLMMFSTRHVESGTRPSLRIRSRAIRLDATAGQVLVCPVHVREQEPPIPTVTCRLSPDASASAGVVRAAPPQAASRHDVEPARSEPQPEETAAVASTSGERPTTTAPDQLAQEVLARLTALEQRLERLETLLTAALGRETSNREDPSQTDGQRGTRESRRQLLIDTTPPW